ncbi:MAG: S41 family peptidase [bacterium]
MKISNKSSLIISGVIILVFGFGVGWFSKPAYKTGVQLANGSVVDTDASKRGADMEYFWKAWDLLKEKHVNAASTTAQVMVYGAIKGIASSFGDDYTQFFPPVESKAFNDDISGSIEGVGMELGIKDSLITVIAPIKDSPADKAGVKTGDKIIKINGKEADKMAVEDAVKLIRGAKGTEVTITFVREGTIGTIEKKIMRDVINIPTIKTDLKKGTGGSADVFVIQLYSFNAQSPTLFRGALREFLNSGTNKLVIDLRGNPGGYLEAATDMASFFLPSGKTIVSEDYGAKKSADEYKSKGYDIFDKSKYDIVVLIDGGSASASEILAGALSEHGVAKLVGTKSFGKGSVQELVNLASDTSLKITIAKWLTPKGHNISKEGITPDYIVPITQDDITKKKDPQLDKALEIIRKTK